VVQFAPRSHSTLEQMVAQRVEFLTAYQNAAYAQSYREFVEQVHNAEAALGDCAAAQPLSRAVARYLFKLMAYKDEYEVARLHTDAAFVNKINALFEGDFKVRHHLAPPLLARKSSAGELQKSSYGPWVRSAFALLVPLKVLRGTAFDVFGYSEERRSERALIAQYRQDIASLLPTCMPPGWTPRWRLPACRSRSGVMVMSRHGIWRRREPSGTCCLRATTRPLLRNPRSPRATCPAGFW
jgi:indolepyruvate ferredoxin oxidoreductase